MMRISFLILILSCTIACKEDNDQQSKEQPDLRDQALQALIQTDRAFSDSCKKLGMKKGYFHFLADEAVLLRPGYAPILDGDVIKFLSAQEDTSFQLSWNVTGGEIAASSDLGYTYGLYQVATGDTVLRGTYLSVWKQQKGQWKLVADSGNQGVGETDLIQ